MEDISSIVVVLWMLSLVTEKIVNSVKLNTPALRNETQDVFAEKRREKKIQRLSIVTGIVVALITKANFFLFFKLQEEGTELFTWNKMDFEGEAVSTLFSCLVGCVITGLFLSFGSKFFHELLDVLLQYKNIKRKIAERKDWNFNSIEEVDSYAKVQESDRIEDFLEKELLDKFPAVSTFEFDPLRWEVTVYAETEAALPSVLNYKSSLGKVKPITIRTLKSGPVLAMGGIDIYPSETISNRKKGSSQGAIGCVVRDEDGRLCLLTCYHTVKADTHPWGGIAQNDPDLEVAFSPEKDSIGTIRKGYRDHMLDAAVVLPDNKADLYTMIPDDATFFKGQSRPVYGIDHDRQTPVCLKSAVRKKNVQGKITHIARPVNVTYPDGIHKMLDLLEIQSLSGEAFSVEGDSGSIVVDKNGVAIGLLIAGDSIRNFSYAIPISRIEEKLKIKVI